MNFLEGSFDFLKGVQSGGYLRTRTPKLLSDATPNVAFLQSKFNKYPSI